MQAEQGTQVDEENEDSTSDSKVQSSKYTVKDYRENLQHAMTLDLSLRLRPDGANVDGVVTGLPPAAIQTQTPSDIPWPEVAAVLAAQNTSCTPTRPRLSQARALPSLAPANRHHYARLQPRLPRPAESKASHHAAPIYRHCRRSMWVKVCLHSCTPPPCAAAGVHIGDQQPEQEQARHRKRAARNSRAAALVAVHWLYSACRGRALSTVLYAGEDARGQHEIVDLVAVRCSDAPAPLLDRAAARAGAMRQIF